MTTAQHSVFMSTDVNIVEKTAPQPQFYVEKNTHSLYHRFLPKEVFIPTDNSSHYGDLEDHREEVMRMVSVLSSSHVHTLYLRNINQTQPHAVWRITTPTMSTQFVESTQIPLDATLLGNLTGAEEIIASPYASSDTFNHPALQSFLNRKTIIVDTDSPEGETQAREFAEGMEKFFVKRPSTKSVTSVVHHTEGSNPLAEVAQQVDTFGWYLPRFLCLQECVDFTYESRIFCVDYTPITGSGRIIHATPGHDHETDTVNLITREDDPWVALGVTTKEISTSMDAHNNNPPVADPHWKEKIILAQRVCDALKEHDTTTNNNSWRDCVVDIGVIHKDGMKLLALVETNSINNAGYYGANPFLITDALLSCEDPGYRGLTYGKFTELMNNMG